MTLEIPVPLIGFAAWSGTGKTTLLTQLIDLFSQSGLEVGVIKHAHHRFDVDYPGKDSYRLRKAGAARTLIASDLRQVRIVERREPREPELAELAAALDVRVLDLVLVEGFRHLRYPKIELHRPALGHPLMYPDDDSIVAVASDADLTAPIPTLNLNNPGEIAGFIYQRLLFRKPQLSPGVSLPVQASPEWHLMNDSLQLQPGDALILVDLQKDFLPGGALGVTDGDAVIPVLNQYTEKFLRRDLPIFATRDWHPAKHSSFEAQGGPWPPHCVAGTPGAAFAEELQLPETVVVISKAESDDDAYSCFEGTDLHQRLQATAAKRLFVGGLATDYCVLNTVLDGLRLGYEVRLLRDAVSAVDVNAGDGERALQEMLGAGARPLSQHDLTP